MDVHGSYVARHETAKATTFPCPAGSLAKRAHAPNPRKILSSIFGSHTATQPSRRIVRHRVRSSEQHRVGKVDIARGDG